MGYYLPELIKGIDVAGESRRLRGVKFAEATPAGEAAPPADGAVAAAAPVIVTVPVDGAGDTTVAGSRVRLESVGEFTVRAAL